MAHTQSLRRIASWVIRNRETREVMFETYEPMIALSINLAKYEFIPILEYLQEFNRSVKES